MHYEFNLGQAAKLVRAAFEDQDAAVVRAARGLLWSQRAHRNPFGAGGKTRTPFHLWERFPVMIVLPAAVGRSAVQGGIHQ